MVSITNDFNFEEECFENFTSKTNQELIATSSLLMLVIDQYEYLCIDKMEKVKEILGKFFTECSKRKVEYLTQYDEISPLTKVYKNLWDYCISHNINPRSTTDGIYYIEEKEIQMTNEEKRLLSSLNNDNLNIKEEGIFYLVAVLKRMIKSNKTLYKYLKIYLSNLFKYYFRIKEYIDNHPVKTYIPRTEEKNIEIIKNFIEIFCKENGLNISKKNIKLELTKTVNNKLDMISLISNLKIESLPTGKKINVIKELMESLTVEFKKSRYLENESFHRLRSNNHCLKIDKCIHDIQDNFLITIDKDGDWSVRVIKT